MDEIFGQVGRTIDKVDWSPGPWEQAVELPGHPIDGQCHNWFAHGASMFVSMVPGYRRLRGIAFHTQDVQGTGVWKDRLPRGLTPDMTMEDIEALLGTPYHRFKLEKGDWPNPYLVYEIRLDLHLRIDFWKGKMASVTASEPRAENMLKSVQDGESLSVFASMLFAEVVAMSQMMDPNPAPRGDTQGLLLAIRSWAKKNRDRNDENPWRLSAETLLAGVYGN